jgi:hypothetical protein
MYIPPVDMTENGIVPTANGSKPTTSEGPTRIWISSSPLNPSHRFGLGGDATPSPPIWVGVGVEDDVPTRLHAKVDIKIPMPIKKTTFEL